MNAVMRAGGPTPVTATAVMGPIEVSFDAPSLRALASFITDALGIRMPDAKLTMLHGRLQRRLRTLGVATIADYVARLEDPVTGPAELVHFFDLATTNKTDFFREPDHFEHLAQKTLPALAPKRGGPWTCRVWCAGCSTGEEVYTLGMVLSEYMAGHPGFDFQIWATDISTRVLKQAAQAVYTEADIGPIPDALRRKYLLRSRDRQDGLIRIDRALRNKVRFDRLNFMDETYDAPGTFDVIFFRNVLIYFDRPTQEAVVGRQCRHLRPGGALYISHSESLNGLALPLETIGSSVFRRLAG